MKKLTSMMMAALLYPAVAHASDGCKVEDWKWSNPIPTMLVIEGVTTCEAGSIILRLYEGEGGAFIGVERAFIRGYTFKALRTATNKPKALFVKYVIKER